MQFDSEQVGQLRQIMDEAFESERLRQVIREEVTPIIKDAEERIVIRVVTAVGQMIDENVLPQFDELRAEFKRDINGVREDLTEVKYDVGCLKRDMTSMRTGRWQLAA